MDLYRLYTLPLHSRWCKVFLARHHKPFQRHLRWHQKLPHIWDGFPQQICQQFFNALLALKVGRNQHSFLCAIHPLDEPQLYRWEGNRLIHYEMLHKNRLFSDSFWRDLSCSCRSSEPRVYLFSDRKEDPSFVHLV